MNGSEYFQVQCSISSQQALSHVDELHYQYNPLKKNLSESSLCILTLQRYVAYLCFQNIAEPPRHRRKKKYAKI